MVSFLLIFLVSCTPQVNPAPTATFTTLPTATLATGLPQYYISPQLPIQFDYPAGWTVREYQNEKYKNIQWILLSNQPAFFANPLDPANSGAIINIGSYGKGPQLAQYETLLQKIAATMSLKQLSIGIMFEMPATTRT
jgi:hypothetical protein